MSIVLDTTAEPERAQPASERALVLPGSYLRSSSCIDTTKLFLQLHGENPRGLTPEQIVELETRFPWD